MGESKIVWLTEERTFAQVISVGAYFTLVSYTRAGIEHEVLIENDEIIDGGRKSGNSED